MANRVTIYIHNQRYRFLADEDEDYLQQCADIVNKEMDRAMEGGIDDVGLGVLFGLEMYKYEFAGLLMHAAMNVTDKYCKERQVSDNLRAQLKQALDENARLARSLAEANREARKAGRQKAAPKTEEET